MPWQPAPIVFPDIELVLTTALRPLLATHGHADVRVDRKIPNPRPKRIVVINRDGGNDDGVTDRPRVRVRVWDTTAEAASSLAGLVVALMPLLVGTTPIVRVQKLSGPIEIPDSSGADQRYLLFQLATEGTPLS